MGSTSRHVKLSIVNKEGEAKPEYKIEVGTLWCLFQRALSWLVYAALQQLKPVCIRRKT
jgi:hypothetical protein